MAYGLAWFGSVPGRRARGAHGLGLLLISLGCARAPVGEEPLDASARMRGGDPRADAGDASSAMRKDGGGGGDVSTADAAQSGAGDAASDGSGHGGHGDAGGNASGSDAATCAMNERDCGNGCVDVLGTAAHCGTCDVSCPGTGAACSNGQCTLSGCTWASYGGHDYFLCDTTQQRAFAEARTFCRTLGLDLVVLDDANEHTFLKGQVSVTGGWLGLTDLDTEGTWRKIDTRDGGTAGTVVWLGGPASSGGMVQNAAYLAWSATEPSDGNGNEDCAYQIADTWWDGVCTETKPFACETR